MTNLEYLKNNIEELAKLLIMEVTEPIYDYNYEENLEHMYDDCYLVTSDGERYNTTEYDNALAHEIEWLNTERINEDW